MPGAPIRVLCIDDNELIAMGLEAMIGLEEDLECVGTRGRADTLLADVAATCADVVLLDLKMPGKDPLDACAELVAAKPEVRVVVSSGLDDRQVQERVREAGAAGFIAKSGDIPAIITAIRRVAAGETFFP